jgi:hypothetical protein
VQWPQATSLLRRSAIEPPAQCARC